MDSFVKPTFIFILFCLTHSIFASVYFKQKVFNHVPTLKPYYRLIYNGLALFLLALWIVCLPDNSTVYRVRGVWFFILVLIQVLALLLAIKSISGHGISFLGIQQIKQFLSEKRKPSYLDEPKRGKLTTTGLYRYMRHPLYTFSMIVLIASPVMTHNLVFIIGCVGIYFWIGSFFEERNLIKRFGDDYKKYQKEVPRFIPYKFLFFQKK